MKKLDKLVSKLANKHKTNMVETSDHPQNDGTDESILHRMKTHLLHHSRPDGVPPAQVIVDDLKESPFKGKTDDRRIGSSLMISYSSLH
jgi:hypothetical protein